MTGTELGRIGEETAAGMLRASGYRILERNYRRSGCEIDIIALKDGRLTFVEVKTRRGCGYGRPCEAVNARKRRNIRRAAACYMDECGREGTAFDEVCFDVMEVYINHIRKAF